MKIYPFRLQFEISLFVQESARAPKPSMRGVSQAHSYLSKELANPLVGLAISTHTFHVTPEQHFLEIIVARLYERGIFEHDDLLAIADDLDSSADSTAEQRETLADMAYGVRCMIIEGMGPSNAHQGVDSGRRRFRVIDGNAE